METYTNLTCSSYIELLGSQENGYNHSQVFESVWCYAIKEMKGEGKRISMNDHLCDA